MTRAEKAELRRGIEAMIACSSATHEEAEDLLLEMAVDQHCLEYKWPATRQERSIMACAGGMSIADCGVLLTLGSRAVAEFPAAVAHN